MSGSQPTPHPMAMKHNRVATVLRRGCRLAANVHAVMSRIAVSGTNRPAQMFGPCGRGPRFAVVRHKTSEGGQVSVQDVYSSNAVAGLEPEFHEPSSLLSEDERRLAATYEQAGIGIVEIDATGKLLRVNGHLCNLLGLGPDALL